jgi:predicted dehydrogenase
VNRRNFVTAAAGTLAAAGKVLGANDRIRLGLIGNGGRCTLLSTHLKALQGHEVVMTSDVYQPRREAMAQKMGAPAKPVRDYHEVLDSKDVDAVVIASPDHWHARMVLDAVAAGKDVYCEKPVTHTIAEGEPLIAGVEKSGRVVATGTQQRSWDHFIQGKALVESGKLGQIALAQCYWYQNYNRAKRPADAGTIDAAKLDWKSWLGTAPDQPFAEIKYRRWRWFWDFGGGAFTDLMTHWIDVIMWYMNSPVPQTVSAFGAVHVNHELQCPDTVNAAIEFPNNYTAVYTGTMIESLEDGGIVLRGTDAMMKLTRGGFDIYREGKGRGGQLPEPELSVKSTGDGTRTNLQNWLDCIRSRKQPNANIRAGVEAARTSHLANQAMREGRRITV